MLILNLACGHKMSDFPGVVNIDQTPALLLRKHRLLYTMASPLLGSAQRKRIEAYSDSILVHDLRKGIPYADATVDVVYHSHLLEHLDASVARPFLQENMRVLKPGGVLRIVVPDLESSCRAYLAHLEKCDRDRSEIAKHPDHIRDLIFYLVTEDLAPHDQHKWQRAAIKLIFGSHRRRGHTHRWMYDRISLPYLVTQSGFANVHLTDYRSSAIPSWHDVGLDLDERGNEYRPGSLYVEATKP